MMTAVVVDCKRRESDSQYRTLLAGFDSSHQSLKKCSEDLRRVIAEVAGGLPYDAAKLRIIGAAQAHEDAREEFEQTVAALNMFMVDEIVSSRSAIRDAAPFIPAALTTPR